MNNQEILWYTWFYSKETGFWAPKSRKFVKILIQGPMARRLDIFKKLKSYKSFFLWSNVDGGIQWQNEQYFYSVSEICSFRDPLPIDLYGFLARIWILGGLVYYIWIYGPFGCATYQKFFWLNCHTSTICDGKFHDE